ncbi:MAG: hypothetical protein IKZ44_03780 [Clostridia bacterium]|nr:hypothetical protein [Clostridia bacterium]
MKRILAVMIAAVLLFAVPILSGVAAGDDELGEMLIESVSVTGEVGEIVKVNFELYPNLPDGRKLDSLSGSMKYDPEFVTLGAINQVDEENNLTSLMKGKASSFQYNIDENEKGMLRFAFIDAFGIEAEGFWFQAEFRIEKEGATDFIFNGIRYTGLDAEYHTVSYYIEPVSVGGIHTENETVPTDGAADETFAPITPAVATPVVVTPTPKPSNGGQVVPITSTLPTVSTEVSTPDGIVTPPPAVTSMPVTTPAPYEEKTAAPENTETQPLDPNVEATETQGSTETQPLDPNVEPTETQGSAETGEQGSYTIEDVTGENGTQGTQNGEKQNTTGGNETQQSNTLLIIGVIIGIIAVLGLGALAIVLILKRRGMQD